MQRGKSLVLIKSGAVQRELIGEIITRFERKGIKIVGMKMMQLDESLLDEHYAHLSDKPFFGPLKRSMMATPIVALALEGWDITRRIRQICGHTNPREAAPGTIRGDYSISLNANVVHASDSEENAAIELERFFSADEIFEYKRMDIIDYADE